MSAGEAWLYHGGYLQTKEQFQSADGSLILIPHAGGPSVGSHSLTEEQVIRIKDDHNAMAGLDPEALGELLEECDALIRQEFAMQTTGTTSSRYGYLKRALAALRAPASEESL